MSDYSSNIDFIDLKSQQALIRSEIEQAITKVLDHGNYIMGPEVKDLEKKLGKFCNVDHVISCANGTDAISLALMSLDVKKNDAIFVPSFTYIATAEAPAILGLKPFFVDVDKDSFNLCPISLKNAIEESIKIGLNPKVIISVELFGNPTDYAAIKDIAKEYDIKLLIDAAQSFGSSYKKNMIGSIGDIVTTSFFPAKPMGCYGDGGAIFTNNKALSQKLDSLRLHGRGEHKYDHPRIGMNSRLDSIQACIIIEKLKIFKNELKKKQLIADKYNHELSEICKVPILNKDCTSSWAQYTIQVDKRDELKAHLERMNIPTAIYYPIPLHMQEGYKDYPTSKLGCPNSEELSKKVISLPMSAYLAHDAQKKIINEIKNFYLMN